ncbi:hypothetical protein ACFLRX_08355 [Acidobacteriota bacterium]
MKTKKLLNLCVLMLCVFPFLLQGAQINLSNTTNQSVWCAIASNDAGEIMVVWSEWEFDGIWYRIQRNGVWSEKKKSGILPKKSWSNQLAVDSNGTFHLAYADGFGSLGRDIQYSYFNGTQWSPAERVYTSYHNSAWNRIDVDSNDDIYVQWYHKYENLDLVSDIVSISKPKLGSWPTSYENVSRSSGWESIHPAFRVRNGNVYSAYMDDEGPRRVYYAERINGRWANPVEIGSGYYPAIEIDDYKNIHVVWSQWDGRFYYRSRVNGQWDSREIISNGVAPLYFGDIRAKNNVLVANWVQVDGDRWGVYASAKIPGSQWITPMKIGDTLPLGDGEERLVQVALDNKGCAHFVWHGVGLGGETDIFYATYCASGADVNFIELDEVALNFTAEESNLPSPQTFRVRNTGQENLNYSLSPDKNWVIVDPRSGSSSGEWDTVSVSVDSSSLAPGTYEAVISVSSAEALNSPATVRVFVTIAAAGTTSGPFGVLDTPVDGASVSGSIAVTGWALDDIEVARIEIKRASHGLDLPDSIGADGLVYIGDALFVEGSRPDVEQLYSSYPMSNRAGWGYMLLTFGLPNQGNGTYVLHAFAYDIEGNRVWLGQKTIYSDNANSVIPFGTIDTPVQGGIVSGTQYVNFGWGLTPQPKTIPVDGSTIWVWVDGVALGHPVYNIYRTDIATSFPGYANSDGAIGYFHLDTTSLADGMHTISWTITDNAGITGGIGSRFFTVVNAGINAVAQLNTPPNYAGLQEINPNTLSFKPSLSLTEILNLPVSFKPLSALRGYDVKAEPEFFAPDPSGILHVKIEQLGRLEIGLEGRIGISSDVPVDHVENKRFSSELNVRPRADSWSGYLVVGGEIRALPIGSSFNPKSGVFRWQPGPAFLGKYQFVFIRNHDYLPVRTQIMVHVGPDSDKEKLD